jgi:glycine hydroxymethyltransferase
MLIDLRNKGFQVKMLKTHWLKQKLPLNKNMVPFDDKSPFVTSGIRVGTPAYPWFEADMDAVVALIDKVIMNHTNEDIIEEVAIK